MAQDSKCSVAECDRPAHSRGWCITHYSRWRTHGDPLYGGAVRIRGDNVRRFWSKVDKDGPLPTWAPFLGPCWLCREIRPDGYGRQFKVSEKLFLPHRFAYELAIGPVPPGKFLDHLCRVRHCVNPAHLEPVTSKQNKQRGITKNELKTHCSKGHPFDVENTYVPPAGGQRQCRECKRKRSRKYYHQSMIRRNSDGDQEVRR